MANVQITKVIIGVLLSITISCGPPQRSELNVPITHELFEQITRSDVFYGYSGSGRISDVADLGAIKLEISLDQVLFDRSLSYITIAGQVLDSATREPFEADVVIGEVEFLGNSPYRIKSKKWVISGANGEFVIDSKIESGDRLFIACLGYTVRVYNIHKLLDLK
ncbi:MAG: hypothetical protein F4207_04725 [Gemmatimonadetes bacterium]|nr:hypothetical protein [Gemmatimonadota bacterium]MYH18167.1 hypothetical protein [Gemmatimonadota bacterium]